MITRFAVIPDERKILLGIDKGELFEPGFVYEATKILDQIVIRKVGEYALSKTGHPSEMSEVNSIVYYGNHLYTKEEFEKLK